MNPLVSKVRLLLFNGTKIFLIAFFLFLSAYNLLFSFFLPILIVSSLNLILAKYLVEFLTKKSLKLFTISNFRVECIII